MCELEGIPFRMVLAALLHVLQRQQQRLKDLIRVQLIVEIGMCPVKPAEFVIFRIGQMPTGGDVSE